MEERNDLYRGSPRNCALKASKDAPFRSGWPAPDETVSQNSGIYGLTPARIAVLRASVSNPFATSSVRPAATSR